MDNHDFEGWDIEPQLRGYQHGPPVLQALVLFLEAPAPYSAWGSFHSDGVRVSECQRPFAFPGTAGVAGPEPRGSAGCAG